MQAVAEETEEIAEAVVVGDYVSSVRETEAIEVLHNAKECWGTIRLAPKESKDDVDSEEEEIETAVGTPIASPPIAENVALQVALPGELRLMHEEELYLSTHSRIRLTQLEESKHYEDVCRRSGTPDFGRMYRAYCHFRAKGYVVKVGLQFGCDYLLYRGSPDEFHAEVCALIVNDTKPLSWRRLKTIARLAQDVRKRLSLCYVPLDPNAPIFDMLIDDAFQRPPDSAVSAKRKCKNAVITAEARKRHRASPRQSPSTPSAPPPTAATTPAEEVDEGAPIKAAEYSEIAELLGNDGMIDPKEEVEAAGVDPEDQ